MEEPEKLERIIEARMKLKARFEQQMQATPSLADDQPKGSGPPNRHGMPAIPIGQTKTVKWPVLDLGYHPNIPQERWRLTIDGAVEHPVVLTWKDFMTLPQTKDTSDFHCVTTWSKLDMHWKGVSLIDLAALVLPKPEATHLLCYGYDTYTTNIALEEALKPDVLVSPHLRRAAAAPGTWRPLPHGHAAALCLERRQMDQTHPVPDGEQAGFLGRAWLFQHRLSLAE
ncbi:DMSO/TMAO reductase YedYZ molybdopterin-dependent catalytic subunit [Mucilaginibacter sp. OAE612]